MGSGTGLGKGELLIWGVFQILARMPEICPHVLLEWLLGVWG